LRISEKRKKYLRVRGPKRDLVKKILSKKGVQAHSDNELKDARGTPKKNTEGR